MPSFSMSFRSCTSTFNPNCLPSFFASEARWLGVAWLPGRLPHSRASATPAATAWPRCRPRVKAAASLRALTSATRASFGAAGALGLVCR